MPCMFQNLTRLYLDKATLVWNGNNISGQDALGEFFESLPSSEFQVHTLDCQPVHGMCILCGIVTACTVYNHLYMLRHIYDPVLGNNF